MTAPLAADARVGGTCKAALCGRPLFGDPPWCPYCGTRQPGVAVPEEDTAIPPPPPAEPLPVTPTPGASPPQPEDGSGADALGDGTATPITLADDGITDGGGEPLTDDDVGPGASGWSEVLIWLIVVLLGVAAALALWSLLPNRQPGSTGSTLASTPTSAPGAEVTVYATEQSAIRTTPTTSANRPAAFLSRGDQAQGTWDQAGLNGDRWLKLSRGDHAGMYVNGASLSTRKRPWLVSGPSRSLKLVAATSLREEPFPDAPVVEEFQAGESVYPAGRLASRWWEVTRKKGIGIGYLPPDSLESDTPSVLNMSANR